MELLQALADWPVAAALRQSAIAYPLVNAAHILSLALVIGTIATLDLRLLGLFGQAPLGVLAPPLWKMAATGIVLAAATGFLLFSVRPVHYAQNPAFLIKVGLVVLGVANAGLLRANRHWRTALGGARPHMSIRIAALVSLTIWAGAIVAGRWIGFLG